MLRTVLIVTIATALMSPARGWTQHLTGEALTRVKPEYNSCGMCHNAHNPWATADALRLSPLRLVVTTTRTPAPELDAVSQSCLRCHLTPELRDRQPEFDRNALSERSAASFLGVELGDDHPVGYVERDLVPASARKSHGLDLPSTFRSVSRRGLARTEHLSCTSCHDPHDRTRMVASAEQQAALCTGCHASGVYALGGHASLACGDCHRIHGGAGQMLAKAVIDQLCNTCHQPGSVPLERPAAQSSLPRAPSGHDRRMGDSCLSCHGAHK